jgi:DNA-directed RNA polymerase I subunit RPA2
MEDAMIINKSSFERGFGHGMVYSTDFVELNEKSFGQGRNTKIFALDPKLDKLRDKLDFDGLPHVGTTLNPGDPYYW